MDREGRSVLTLFLLVVRRPVFEAGQLFLFLFISFAASTHSATPGVPFGVCCMGWILRPWLPVRLTARELTGGSLTIVSGAAVLLASNFALSGLPGTVARSLLGNAFLCGATLRAA